MEVRIEEAAARAHLVSARFKFNEFQVTTRPYGAGEVDHILSSIRNHLAEAGVDVSALDESGESSAEAMEVRIEEAVAHAHQVMAEAVAAVKRKLSSSGPLGGPT